MVENPDISSPPLDQTCCIFPLFFCMNLCIYSMTSQSKPKLHKENQGKHSMYGLRPLKANIIGKTPVSHSYSLWQDHLLSIMTMALIDLVIDGCHLVMVATWLALLSWSVNRGSFPRSDFSIRGNLKVWVLQWSLQTDVWGKQIFDEPNTSVSASGITGVPVIQVVKNV